jgi:hypothetical protein
MSHLWLIGVVALYHDPARIAAHLDKRRRILGKRIRHVRKAFFDAF